MVFVQNDYNSCELIFNIIQDISDYTLVLTVQLPDTTIIVMDLIKLDENTASITLPTSTLSQNGIVNCQIAIHGGGSRLTHAIEFHYKVVRELEGDTIEASDQVPVLTNLINKVLYLETWVKSIEFKVVESDLIMEVDEWLV